MSTPRLALTLGDPAGIGPEIVLKTLADPHCPSSQITVVGSRRVLHDTYRRLRGICEMTGWGDRCQPLKDPDAINLIDIDTDPATPGEGTAATGDASFAYLQAAIQRTQAGEFDAIITSPIAKSLWHQAGHIYPGQTECLAQGANCDRFGMMFVGRSPHTGWTLRSLLATTHIPLQDVPQALTPELLTEKLDLLVESLQRDFGIGAPDIAIAGLNPHSGEAGDLGREEVERLQPWLEEERRQRPGIKLRGLTPPDTLWVNPGRAWFERADVPVSDAYLALYHDQGLIPVKLMAFDLAVNTTIGLPFIRTSPDHGTAFDIAGKGIASTTSTLAAIALAQDLALRRQRLNIH
ncbi:4-hydroxythreonine-4-phosphate dehydrogenase PdxA [Phormidium yuhuli AB48]|uniref:4-hydroxythreonine-4-phosphate dehydrogenase n=1 Tax=Phormidium yuhuli AB48 TaxID=2940671 RepID=A0ABY5ANM8_9CYAN|nr:4-hydroxythreonine-4-phosphate dehydrogenase PdxA [Phormidium yuhuli]USR90605.1 4-hydroxythreonine-4-phosphate dehydrogenase PdxA [Phormidium yuhuli AB48]